MRCGRMRLLPILSLIASLSACATQAPPALDSYCRKYQRLPDPADAVNLKQRANKLAILANEETYVRDCALGNQTAPGGPR